MKTLIKCAECQAYRPATPAGVVDISAPKQGQCMLNPPIPTMVPQQGMDGRVGLINISAFPVVTEKDGCFSGVPIQTAILN